MTAIPISLDDEQLARLSALAERAGMPPGEYLHREVAALLDQPDEAFSEAADRVLKKNAELYRRLA